MAPRSEKSEAVLARMSDGVIRSLGELLEIGVSKQTLRRLVEAGRLSCPADGIYQLAGAETDQYEQYAVIAKRMPGSIMNLFTAAAIHRITQVMPGDIWIGLPPGHTQPPRLGEAFGAVEIKPLRWSRAADLSVGVETIPIRGVDVRVTSPARTVVDMWRYSSLNRSLPSHHARVDEESFINCIATYLSSDHGGTPAELGSVAARLGVLEGMRPHILGFGHAPAPGR